MWRKKRARTSLMFRGSNACSLPFTINEGCSFLAPVPSCALVLPEILLPSAVHLEERLTVSQSVP